MSHLDDCECVVCQHGPAELERIQNESLQKYGWFAHYVGELEGQPLDREANLVNFHTHGLNDTHNHLDFQVVLPVPPKVCHSIFWRLVNLIEEGRVFEEDEVTSGVIGNDYQVTFKKVREGNRQVLRVIMPDASGNLDEDELSGMYKEQYAEL